jgi:diguanylate cyclase (GGDEF)-like protein
VGANLELEKVSAILVQELRRILHCTGCAVLQFNGQKATVLADCGFAKVMGSSEFDKDMPAISYILNTGESILTGDVATSPAAACLPSGCNMRSLICAPVVVAGEVKGIIHLDSPEANAFDEDDLALVQLLCTEVSFVFERSLNFSRVHSQSLRDGLTGCFNRRAFEQDLEEAFGNARAAGAALSLIMMDVDHFKAFNDHHGHPKGDDLLAELAAVLRGELRASDKLFRYGGEEFAMLLPRAHRRQATIVAQRLRKAVEACTFEGASASQPHGHLTLSAGVAEYPGDADDRRALLMVADAALYRAKRAGRNRVAASPLAQRYRAPADSGNSLATATG